MVHTQIRQMSGLADFLSPRRDNHAAPSAAIHNLSAAYCFALSAGQQRQHLRADNRIHGAFTKCTKRLMRVSGRDNVVDGSINEFLNILINRKG